MYFASMPRNRTECIAVGEGMDTRVATQNWVERYGDMLYSYALTRVGDEISSQDLVQETFMAALQSRSSFSGQSTEKTWLVGILKHKIMDHFRKRYRGIEKDLEFSEDADETYSDKGDWRGALELLGREAEISLDSEHLIGALKGCIQSLPRVQRAVFALRELRHLETDEICNLLGITSTNMGVLLYRARQRLRVCLAEKLGGGQSDATQGSIDMS